uniref:Uncharacterized protein n=1 Tax=Oryza brachyantha TaxID=4533 RepID=J3KW45_ORYBR
MEEAPELTGPRISFSHDGVVATAGAATPGQAVRLELDTSSRRLPEPEFDFANAAAADVAPAGRLFAGGKLLPVPPLPPVHPKPSPCKQQARGSVKAPQQPARRPCSWTSPFTRSCSVNSATTATASATTAPRAAPGGFSAGELQLPVIPAHAEPVGRLGTEWLRQRRLGRRRPPAAAQESRRYSSSK